MFELHYVLTSINIILISVLFARGLVAYYQSEGYDLFFGIKRYFKSKSIRYYIINILVLLIILFINVLCFICDFKNMFFVLLNDVSVVFLMFYNFIDYDSGLRIKLTNRIKRLILLTAIAQLSQIILTVLFSDLILFNGLFLLLGSCFVFYVSILFSSIFEHFNNLKFILKAKKKLDKMQDLKVVGIVGSYAKSSVKNLLFQILEYKFNVLCTPKNYNTLMGITKTILNDLNNNHEIFVVEMGADHPGDIKKILKYFDVDMGILTGVNLQHIEKFRTLENLIKTKFYIIDYLNCRKLPCFVCEDNIIKIDTRYNEIHNNMYTNDNLIIKLDRNNANKDCVLYNKISAKNNQFLINIMNREKECTIFNIKFNHVDYCFKTNLVDDYNISNLSVAIAVAIKMGVGIDIIKVAVLFLKGVAHRMEFKQFKGGALVIDNSYNSNISSYPESLKKLRNINAINKYVVTPGLIELGKFQYDENFKFGKKIAEMGFDLVITKKVNFKALVKGYRSVSKKPISFYEKFNSELKSFLESLDSDNAILIENDLPENYK